MRKTLRGSARFWLAVLLAYAMVLSSVPAQGLAEAVEEVAETQDGEAVVEEVVGEATDGSESPETAEEVIVAAYDDEVTAEEVEDGSDLPEAVEEVAEKEAAGVEETVSTDALESQSFDNLIYAQSVTTLENSEVTISLGSYHSSALKTDGSLWMWGSNSYGVLGDDTLSNRKTPIKVSDDVVAVSQGTQSLDNSFGSCSSFIKSDGTLWMWGYNYHGRLGNGSTDNCSTPTKVLDNVRIATVRFHSAAIKTDGSLWTWGPNFSGQLGDGTVVDRYSPIKIMDDVIAVSLGQNHSAAITAEGNLWMWGDNSFGQLGDGTYTEKRTPILVMNDVARVSLGTRNTAAIKSDGSLWMWGDNYWGQIGDGTTTSRATPVKIMDDVNTVALGENENSAAIKRDGSLWMWGTNSKGSLGDGTTTEQHIPIKIMDNVAAVSLGRTHSAAIKEDRTLWTWGGNSYGQLGDGTTSDRTMPVQVMEKVAIPINSIGTKPDPSTYNLATAQVYINGESADSGGVKVKWTGSAVEPEVSVQYSNGEPFGIELVRDRDYTVTFEDNVKPGTAKVTITGMGEYSGEVSVIFEIVDGDAEDAAGRFWPSIDGWGFGNSQTSYWTAGPNIDDELGSPELSESLFYRIFPRCAKNAELYETAKLDGENGLCHGLSLASIMSYTGVCPVSDWECSDQGIEDADFAEGRRLDFERARASRKLSLVPTKYQRNITCVPLGDSLEDYVQMAQVAQFLPWVVSSSEGHMVKGSGDAMPVLEEIETSLKAGHPIIVRARGPVGGAIKGHALVPYRVDHLDDGGADVYVYDTMRPRDNGLFMTFRRSSGRMAWKYSGTVAGKPYTFGSATGKGSISLESYATLLREWQRIKGGPSATDEVDQVVGLMKVRGTRVGITNRATGEKTSWQGDATGDDPSLAEITGINGDGGGDVGLFWASDASYEVDAEVGDGYCSAGYYGDDEGLALLSETSSTFRLDGGGDSNVGISASPSAAGDVTVEYRHGESESCSVIGNAEGTVVAKTSQSGGFDVYGLSGEMKVETIIDGNATTRKVSAAGGAGFHVDGSGRVEALPDAYAVLYSDGELVVQRGDETDSARGEPEGKWVLDEDAVYDARQNKVPWYKHVGYYPDQLKATKVTVADRVRPKSIAQWFSHSCIKEVGGLENLDTSRVTSMKEAFRNCGASSLDLRGLDTSRVTDMSYMFSDCGMLESVDLSGLDTSRVTNMFDMFYGCSLRSLDLSGFDTSSVTNMGYMFSGSEQYHLMAKELDLSSFDTSNVEEMGGMFEWCAELQRVDLSSFDTSHVRNVNLMFSHCASLEMPDLSRFDTSSVESMGGMFSQSGIRRLDLSSWDTSGVTIISGMFSGCASLESLDLSGWDTSSVTSMAGMFAHCESLERLDLSGLETPVVEEFASLSMGQEPDGLFDGCSRLTDLDISGLDTSRCEECNAAYTVNTHLVTMLRGCTSLRRIRVGVRFPLADAFPFDVAASSRWWSESTGRWYVSLEALSEREGFADTYTTYGAGDLGRDAVVGVPDREYAGVPLSPEPIVTVGGKKLARGVDYECRCEKLTGVGTTDVSIEGIGNYTGSIAATFRVVPANLGKADVSGLATETYDGKAHAPTPVVRLGGRTLRKGADYTVSYRDNTSAGTATVTVTGRGNYVGTKTATFAIAKAANGMTARAKNVTLKASKLRKKSQSVKASKLATVKGAHGKLTYKLKSVTKKKFKKYFKVAKSGKITAKKSLPKGTYRLKVAVTAAGDANHEAATKTVTVKAVVK